MLDGIIKKLGDFSASVERFNAPQKLDRVLKQMSRSQHSSFAIEAAVASGFGYAVAKIYNANPIVVAFSFAVGQFVKSIITEFAGDNFQALIGNEKSLNSKNILTPNDRWGQRLRTISLVTAPYAMTILFGYILKKSGSIPSTLVASSLFYAADHFAKIAGFSYRYITLGLHPQLPTVHLNYFRSLFRN